MTGIHPALRRFFGSSSEDQRGTGMTGLTTSSQPVVGADDRNTAAHMDLNDDQMHDDPNDGDDHNDQMDHDLNDDHDRNAQLDAEKGQQRPSPLKYHVSMLRSFAFRHPVYRVPPQPRRYPW